MEQRKLGSADEFENVTVAAGAHRLGQRRVHELEAAINRGDFHMYTAQTNVYNDSVAG